MNEHLIIEIFKKIRNKLRLSSEFTSKPLKDIIPQAINIIYDKEKTLDLTGQYGGCIFWYDPIWKEYVPFPFGDFYKSVAKKSEFKKHIEEIESEEKIFVTKAKPEDIKQRMGLVAFFLSKPEFQRKKVKDILSNKTTHYISYSLFEENLQNGFFLTDTGKKCYQKIAAVFTPCMTDGHFSGFSLLSLEVSRAQKEKMKKTLVNLNEYLTMQVLSQILHSYKLNQLRKLDSSFLNHKRDDEIINIPVLNKTAMYNDIKDRLSRGRQFSVIFLDIDSFGEVNKKIGHQKADTVLFEFAERIDSILFQRENGKKSDRRGRLYRFGGDEFVFILDNFNEIQSIDVASRIQHRISTQQFTYYSNHQITSSMGIMCYPSDWEDACKKLPQDELGRSNEEKVILIANEYTQKILKEINEKGKILAFGKIKHLETIKQHEDKYRKEID